ncbi:MAG: hypothetical protein ACLP4W_30640 [Mycobacterium sp.]|uniref:hypothetical protein n=1 Tax=Mycobacterium sp. TaxID=1785 RepID=UPI003F9B6C9C
MAQEELLRRTRANVEDLAAFFSAREREDAVEAWLTERVNGVLAQAARRRSKARVSAGGALRAMRDRGESLREIARMAGVAEKTARELIREADAAPDAAAMPEAAAGGAELAGPTDVDSGPGIADVGASMSPVSVAANDGLAARPPA